MRFLSRHPMPLPFILFVQIGGEPLTKALKNIIPTTDVTRNIPHQLPDLLPPHNYLNTAVCPSIWYKALTPNPDPREGEGLLRKTRSFDKVL
ncbi:MAG: hypothetical protein Fur0025_16840 [Oscillatoriaceae cyanobacterium]